MTLPIISGVARARRAASIFGVVAVLHGGPSIAAEWIFKPSIDVASFYDDNVGLTTGPQTSGSGYILTPRFNLKRNTETAKLDFDAYSAFTSYQRGDIEDRSETVASLRARNQTSERGTLGVDGDFRRDTLFEQVDQGRGVGDLRDVDVGLSTSTEVRRTFVAANPYFDWLLTERSSMRVGYRLTDVGFGNAGGTGLVDYKEHIVSGTYTHQLTEKNSASLTANAIRYRPQTGASESDTAQLLVGINRTFSETLRGSFAIGGSETTQKEAGTEDKSSGVVMRAELQQKSEISQLDTVVSRDITPSGIGRSLRSDQFRIRWLRKISPFVDFVLEGQLIRTQALEGDDPSADRRYAEIGPSLRWHWLEHWAISAGYRYRSQKYDADSNSADSNAVFLGVTYAL